MGSVLTASALTAKRRSVWPGRFPESDALALRIHRAISWIERAERESDDHDAVFIFYWIAFNAAYAQDIRSAQDIGERGRLGEYFSRLVSLDTDRRIFNAVWDRFSDSVRVLLNNKFVFQPFWNYHNGMAGYGDWESRFQSSRNVLSMALGNSDTETILSTLFDRLIPAEPDDTWRRDLEQFGKSRPSSRWCEDTDVPCSGVHRHHVRQSR